MRRPPGSTLFPYTTLFRSPAADEVLADGVRPALRELPVVAHRAGRVGEALDRHDRRAVVLPDHTREARSEEHTSELQSRQYLVCRLLLEKIIILVKVYMLI